MRREGAIRAYIHHDNRLIAYAVVTCETDFVARNEQFLEFVDGVAMSIAAAGTLDILGRQLQPMLWAGEVTITVQDKLDEVRELFKEKIEIVGWDRMGL